MALGLVFILAGSLILVILLGALLAGAVLVLRYWNERAHHRVEVAVGFTLLVVAACFSLPMIYGLVLLLGN